MSLRFAGDEFIPKFHFVFGSLHINVKPSDVGARERERRTLSAVLRRAVTFERIPFPYFNLAISVVCRQH